MAFINGFDNNKKGTGCIVYSPFQCYIPSNAKAVLGLNPLPDTGKWYWEVTDNSGTYPAIGIANSSVSREAASYNNTNTRSYIYNGNKYPGGVSYGSSYGAGVVIGVAVDMDARSITFYRNGVSQGVAWSDFGAWENVYPYVTTTALTSIAFHINCGAFPFLYPIPDGYAALQQPLKFLFKDGNTVKRLIKGTPHTFSANIMPTMTSNADPAPYAVSANSEYSATYATWRMFDKNDATRWASASGVTDVIVTIDLGPSLSGDIGGYSLKGYPEQSPINWAVYGSNTGLFNGEQALLDVRHDNNWYGDMKKTFQTMNHGSYQYIRFIFNGVNGIGSLITLYECELFNIITPGTADTFETVCDFSALTQQDFDEYGIDYQTLTELPANVLQQLASIEILVNYPDEETAPQSVITCVPNPRIVFSKGDIDLLSIQALKSVFVTYSRSDMSHLRLLMSVDSGQSWKAYYQSSWVTVDTENLNDVKNMGMSPETFNILSQAELTSLISGSSKIRFAYYLESNTSVDVVNTDLLTITVDMMGQWQKAILGTDYNYGYPSPVTLQVSLLENGDYKINY